MEQVKVASAAGLNGLLAMFQAAASVPSLESVLLVGQILVALVTTLYIGTKVWCMWRGKQKGK